MENTDDSLPFVTLSMFIIDEFSFLDKQGRPTGRSFPPQESSSKLYRMFAALTIYSTTDRGWGLYCNRSSYLVVTIHFISKTVINQCSQASLQSTWNDCGQRAWFPHRHRKNTPGIWVRNVDVQIPTRSSHNASSQFLSRRAQKVRNLSTCLHWLRDSVISFEYKTPRIRLTPADLEGTKMAKPKMLHFVCSPSRALSIISEFNATWEPITIYEPIPVRWCHWSCWNLSNLFCPSKICCVPDELDELTSVLRSISIFRYVSLIGVPLQ